MRLSPTRLKTYLGCPKQYRLRYVEEVQVPLTGALAFGRVLHQVIESLHRDGGMDEQIAYQRFDQAWRETLEQEVIFKEGKVSEEEYLDLADEILRGYVSKHRDRPPPLLVEFGFELPWEDHTLSGVIDRIDETAEGLVIVDLKTNRNKPTQEDLDHDLQLTLYSWGVERVLGAPVAYCVHYHLRKNEELITRRGPKDYERAFEEMVVPVVKGIEIGLYPPLIGIHCRWCDYRQICLRPEIEESSAEAATAPAKAETQVKEVKTSE